MNANFGILPQLSEKIRDKQERYKKMAEKSLKEIKKLEKNVKICYNRNV